MNSLSFEHQANRTVDRIGLAIGPIAIILLMLWFSSWTGPDQESAALPMVWVLASSIPTVLAWLGAAIGFGYPLRLWLARDAVNPFAIQVPLGIAALLMLDATCGALGLLQLGGSIGAWVLIVAGITLLLAQIGKEFKQPRAVLGAPHWMCWLASPSIAVLIVASCSAPGWLWGSEFGGYDALSYHLQLPKEWMARGRIEPLAHNVYSFFPGYMEAAYYHLALLRGHEIDWVYACQLLHAILAVFSGALLAHTAAKICGSSKNHVSSTAFVLFMATPWIIVVGSLGYNEIPVILLLAGGVNLLLEDRLSASKKGIMLGLLAGAACGAKLTSIGMMAVPLGVAMMLTVPPQRWLPLFGWAAGAGLIALSPYLIRNFLHASQPLFPFATGILGTAHWTSEQVVAWRLGHFSSAGLSARFGELWQEFFAYGFTSPAGPDEQPQWSALPIFGVLCLIMCVLLPAHRRWGARLSFMLLAQIVFWLAFTHLKSRFLLPSVVPLTLAVAHCIWRPAQSGRNPWTVTGLALALGVLSILPVYIFARERTREVENPNRSGAPAFAIDFANQFTGDGLPSDVREAIGLTASPRIAINHGLPTGSRVLLIGESAPLYYGLDAIVYNTVWDRGPLSQLMREYPDDPARWHAELREPGITHVLVDSGMLRRWERAGWNDPLITDQRIDQFLGEHAKRIQDFPNAVSLHELN